MLVSSFMDMKDKTSDKSLIYELCLFSSLFRGEFHNKDLKQETVDHMRQTMH
jgi:hypothetical protein